MDNPSDAEIEAACVAWLNTSGPLEPAMRAALIAAARVRAKTHVSVPKEPTLEMKYEGMEAADCDIGLVTVGNIYRAILSRLGGSND